MLRDGQFIREDPPKIGAHYIPNKNFKKVNPEELFVQDLILEMPRQRQPLLSRVLRAVLSI